MIQCIRESLTGERLVVRRVLLGLTLLLAAFSLASGAHTAKSVTRIRLPVVGDGGSIPRTPTPTATSTPTPPPSPTATPTPGGQPVRGQPCPQWYHDAITTTGPDGKQYPTWHPAVDPASGCYFGHEHGDDPRTSLANNRMPAFGYVGLLAGDNEPHTGFKVFVQNHGALNSDGRTLAQDAHMIFHQGTGGPKRFDTQFHSLEYDFKEVGGS